MKFDTTRSLKEKYSFFLFQRGKFCNTTIFTVGNPHEASQWCLKTTFKDYVCMVEQYQYVLFPFQSIIG